MGFSLSWLAVRGKTPDVVCSELGLRPTGEREEFPESPIVGASIPGGWFLIVEDHDDRFVQQAVLERISSGCEVVTCSVEEHVMCTGVSGWRHGRKVWSVLHDGQQQIPEGHLQEQGDLPPEYGPIRDRLRSKQKATSDRFVDYVFDVPVDLAKALTGFRHDEDRPDLGDEPFAVLAE